MIYFALDFLNNIHIEKKAILSIILLFLIILEYVPKPITTQSQEYLSTDDNILRNLCSKEKKVLLELPVTHFYVKSKLGIAGGLSYISKTELASTWHKCYLVNGYSGYDMLELQKLDENINKDLNNNNFKKFIDDLKNSKADYVKINYDKMLVQNLNSKIDKITGWQRITDSLYKVH